jgi:two-component system, response regulator YesN
VQRACRFIEEAFADSALSPSTVALQQSTGEAFLEALFARELGMSITEFILQVRINRAKIIFLETPSADPAAVAVEVGIAGTVQFEEAFLRITGVPVAEFRSNASRQPAHA